MGIGMCNLSSRWPGEYELTMTDGVLCIYFVFLVVFMVRDTFGGIVRDGGVFGLGFARLGTVWFIGREVYL